MKVDLTKKQIDYLLELLDVEQEAAADYDDDKLGDFIQRIWDKLADAKGM